MRNPNGYGSVYKLSGRRRKPFAARVTIGFKPENGHPIYTFIGYYKTRVEAMRALALYNGDQIAEKQAPTLFEVYEEWSEEKFRSLKEVSHYVAAFKVLAPLCNKKLPSLTIGDYEKVFIESGKNKPTLQNVKYILKGVYSFAYRKGYIDEQKANLPNFVRFDNAGDGKRENEHESFTKEEIAILWKHKEDPDVQLVLFLIYTGIRGAEFHNLKKSDVHMEERYFDVVASKTAAGVRRVPIADKVLPIAQEWFADQSTEKLCPLAGKMRLDNLKKNHIVAVCERLKIPHLTHDTRNTAITRMTEEGVDSRFIKAIVGHKRGSVTDDVYAKKLDINVLLKAVNTI